jgi:hypothetical protein
MYTDGTLTLTAQDLAIVAQQRYRLMKTKGIFMKSHAIDHEIVAMKTEMVQLKGKLALSKDVEQAGTEKNGERTEKQYQKKDKAWMKVPPQAGEPLTKQIRNKDFHWCVHHMAWTVHLPSNCRLSGTSPATSPAAPTNTNPPPIGVTAAAATLTAKSILGLLESALEEPDGFDY